MKYEDALNKVLDRAATDDDTTDHDLESAEERDALDADLAMARLVQGQFGRFEPSGNGQLVASRRLRVALADARSATSSSEKHRSRWLSWLLHGRVRLAAVAAFAVAVLFVAGPDLTNGPPSLRTPAAEAEIIEGTVAGVSPDGIVLVSGGMEETVRLDGGAVIRDALGNLVPVDEVRSGQVLILTGTRSDGLFVANNVEFKGKLFGVVQSIGADSMRVTNDEMEFIVSLSGATKIEGTLAVGSFVEIEVQRLEDGSLRALEIENEGDEAEESDDDNTAPGVTSDDEGDDGSEDDDEQNNDSDDEEEDAGSRTRNDDDVPLTATSQRITLVQDESNEEANSLISPASSSADQSSQESEMTDDAGDSNESSDQASSDEDDEPEDDGEEAD